MRLSRRLTVEKKEVPPQNVRASAVIASASFSPLVKVITHSWHGRGLFFFLEMAVVKFVFLLLIGSAYAAPKADLWARWQRHDSTSSKVIHHGSWDAFLKKYLITPYPSGINRVQYSDVTPDDRKSLQRYLKLLEALPISTYNRLEQKAYWINLYNALTVQVILSHYPVKSILDINISPGWFSKGPWGAKLVTVEGNKISLDDIEHRILRPIWKDNRIHYGVNCASLSCPNLAPVAYTRYNLERLLDQGARAYVNHPRGVVFNDGQLEISSIYIWYQEDFGGNREGILAHLQKFAEGHLAESLGAYRGDLSDHYDWRLNGP